MTSAVSAPPGGLAGILARQTWRESSARTYPHLVVLGEAGDDYLPQQSIRTLSNVSAPRRHHLKLPLSVLNTLVWRGLPTDRALLAPRVTAFLRGIRDADPFLADDDGVPARLALKDFVDDVNLSDQPLPELERVPDDVAGVLLREPPAWLCQFLQAGAAPLPRGWRAFAAWIAPCLASSPHTP